MNKDSHMLYEAYKTVVKEMAGATPDKKAAFDVMVQQYGFTLNDPPEKIMEILKQMCQSDASSKEEAYELLQVILEANEQLFNQIFEKRWEQIKF